MHEEHYFPNVPPSSLALEHRLRAVAHTLPEYLRCQLYEILSEAHNRFTPTKFDLHREVLTARQCGREIHFPRPLPMVKFSHLLCNYETWLEHKYSLPDFLGVDPGDVVIDCGAYVGGFSLSAVKRAAQLHAFEPERANFRCLERNLASSTQVHLNQVGLYSVSQRIALNISSSSVEHSLLMPDDGQTIERREVEVMSLADYCMYNGLPCIDFLKLEAEGVELEIFEGLRGIRVRKLAIDVSPEREGKSPAQKFVALLGERNYEHRQRGHVLFARETQ
jgi:FkbM family methyltransferase